MAFTKLKMQGSDFRVRVDFSQVSCFIEKEKGTALILSSGETLLVEESFQTVSNRADKADGEAAV